MAYFTTRRQGNIVYFKPCHQDFSDYEILLLERPNEKTVYDCYVVYQTNISEKVTGLTHMDGIEYCRQKVYEVQGLEAMFPQDLSGLDIIKESQS
jgi:hypothetical protein